MVLCGSWVAKLVWPDLHVSIRYTFCYLGSHELSAVTLLSRTIYWTIKVLFS
ncbi:uncharacterized protein LACBIDRAFT_187163, partial [Laccaria bicolor S238N-H82]